MHNFDKQIITISLMYSTLGFLNTQLKIITDKLTLCQINDESVWLREVKFKICILLFSMTLEGFTCSYIPKFYEICGMIHFKNGNNYHQVISVTLKYTQNKTHDHCIKTFPFYQLFTYGM